MKYSIFFLFVIGLTSCATLPKGSFSENQIPLAPDYSQATNWGALPEKEDNADRVPSTLKDNQAAATADVFFIHPTTYTRKNGYTNWNGPTNDSKLNERTDDGTILYQASLFNGAGRVYAPRYRQAHIHAYYEKEDTSSAMKAFELAYQDVKTAFEFYLNQYNEGRPIIIAAHSQGTTHGKRLVKEFFDGKALQKQLVVACLVGIPVEASLFKVLKPCESATEIGCFCSWRTFRKEHEPTNRPIGEHIVVTNPLSWTTATTLASRTLNTGAVLRNFDKIYPQLTDAQVHNGILWVTKPKFPWSFLLTRPNYHIADYNFFYMNVRENAIERTKTFLAKD